MAHTLGGNLQLRQIKTSDLTGGLNADQFVSATGVLTAGRPMIYDANGNAVAGSALYAPLNQSVQVGGVEFSDDYFITTDEPTPITVGGSAANPPLMLRGAPGICSGILSDGQKIKKYNGIATAGLGLPPILAVADLTGRTGTQAVVTLTPGALGTFRVGCYVTITAVSLDTITVTLTWTDETSNARTVTLLPVGGASLTVTGAFIFPIVDIRSGASAITVTATVTGAGTVTCDAGGSISQIS